MWFYKKGKNESKNQIIKIIILTLLTQAQVPFPQLLLLLLLLHSCIIHNWVYIPSKMIIDECGIWNDDII